MSDAPVLAADRPPITVLRVIARLNVGGPARHVIALSAGLASRGYRTLLAHGSVGDGEASLEHVAASEGVRRVTVEGLGPAIDSRDDVRAFRSLLRLVFREQPDVIHTHTSKAGALGRAAAAIFNAMRRRDRRAVVVHTFHGHVLAGYFSPPVSAGIRYAERIAASATDRIVAISPSQRVDLVSRFRVAPAGRTVVIPLGLDLARLAGRLPLEQGLRRELAIAETDPVIGYVGRFVPIKDLETLIDAMALVVRDEPCARLIMVGDGPERAAVEARAARAGIADALRMLGWRDDLPAIYKTIDICAISSRNEGTPVALLEAMAASRAVVATAVGGVPDIVADGRTGLLAPPGEAAAIAAAIVRLIRSPELRQRLGETAAIEVLARYSIERLLNDIDHLYREALLEKRGPGPHAR